MRAMERIAHLQFVFHGTAIHITVASHCILPCNDVELDSRGLQTRQLINQQISSVSSLPFLKLCKRLAATLVSRISRYIGKLYLTGN